MNIKKISLFWDNINWLGEIIASNIIINIFNKKINTIYYIILLLYCNILYYII